MSRAEYRGHRAQYTIEEGAAGFDVLWDRILAAGDAAPTAVLAASDYVAAGLMQAARRRGVVVPDDLSVVGFDDLDVARAITPRLTTIAQPLPGWASSSSWPPSNCSEVSRSAPPSWRRA